MSKIFYCTKLRLPLVQRFMSCLHKTKCEFEFEFETSAMS
jgi:hypothetical protein